MKNKVRPNSDIFSPTPSSEPYFLPPFWWIAGTIAMTLVFFMGIDLNPQVSENFFFSGQDATLEQDAAINRMFPSPTQLFVSARGQITDPVYQKRIKNLSSDLSDLKDVFSVQSLSDGPGSLQKAIESPLWNRVLIADDKMATFLIVQTNRIVPQAFIPLIENVLHKHEAPGFRLDLSGAPYIDEMIRRNILKDMKVFSSVSALVFGVLLLIIFRSLKILSGMIISCLNAVLSALLISQMIGVSVGPLTANVITIIVVLTIMHLIFMTSKWNEDTIIETDDPDALRAAKQTIVPSFWSMATTFLGFASLLFVSAEPLRQLGASGAIGAISAFASAFMIYPSFLQSEYSRKRNGILNKGTGNQPKNYPEKKMKKSALVVMGISAVLILGISSVNSSPSLIQYFKRDGSIRPGLEYIDRNGGSTPLKLVLVNSDQSNLTEDKVLDDLWKLHQQLEKLNGVQTVVSLPLLVNEAKRTPAGFLLPSDWLVKIMEGPVFGRITDQFIDEEKTQALFILMMREGLGKVSRNETMGKIWKTISDGNFQIKLKGGVYYLMSRLSEQVFLSLYSGLALLILIFTVMTAVYSRSLHIGLAVGVCLTIITLAIIGIQGILRIPLDIISSPAPSLAICMGVDSIIHMIAGIRRKNNKHFPGISEWIESVEKVSQPVQASVLVLSVGFMILIFSEFPPTQRFGFTVAVGSVISGITALYVFPYLCILLSKIKFTRS